MAKERLRHLMQQHGIRAKTKRKLVVTTGSRPNACSVAPKIEMIATRWAAKISQYEIDNLRKKGTNTRILPHLF